MIVHEYGSRDVHGAYEHEPLLHAALLDRAAHLLGDVDDLLTLLRVEPQVVGMGLHWPLENCGLWIANCGLRRQASNPQSAIANPQFCLCRFVTAKPIPYIAAN